MTTNMAGYIVVAVGLAWWLGVNAWLMHLSMTGLKRMMMDRASGKEPQLGTFRATPRYERIGNALMSSGAVILMAMLALLVVHS